jgi:hypothetical protein
VIRYDEIRFQEIKTAGAEVPFYNIVKNYNSKKGVGFGYGKKVIQFQRSESPGPAKYNSSYANSNKETTNKSPNKPKFGIGYEKFRLVGRRH